MPSKTEIRRHDLHNRLLDLGEAVITTKGLRALKARDLAAQAGCSVGAIYNVFPDLHHLTLAINGRTFKRLSAQVSGSVEPLSAAPPSERLVAMGLAYLGFAQENTAAWTALFEIDMALGEEIPGWYMAALEALFDHIRRPVAELRPDLSAEDVEFLVRGLFSSIHGIVWLGLQKRISAVPHKELSRMITLILSEIGT
ncbi:MAG TPA: TetR/AcrR family transcriptional regulator [Rhodobacteraceae bacterium]|nr:TetR/AcrR family transcriptional regulator [Paracoccaceae bacterium]